MKVRIDEELCIGAGVCEEICPEIFRVNKDTDKAEIIKEKLDEDDEECAAEAAENCPNQAIILEE